MTGGGMAAVKTPDVGLDDAQAMGYKLTILPVVLFNAVVVVCDEMLDELKRQSRHPADGGRGLGLNYAVRSAGAAGLAHRRRDRARGR